jgi:4-hydroxy-tetrahydrodipicolinate synthase
MPGAESYLLSALKAGASGCISASCNVNAQAIRKLYDDFKAGRPGLPEQQEALSDVRKVLELRPTIPVMKHLLADALREPDWRHVRPPLLPLPDVEAAAIKSELDALGWRIGLS